MRLLLCTLVISWFVGAVQGAEAGRLIDRVWSGHPVGFAFLTERGHQFIAYYDADRRITVLGRRLTDPGWTRVQPPGVPVPKRGRDSNVTGWDSHNSLRLALDRDGCLHLSGNLHVDPLVYYRTRAPFDVSTLERHDRMTGEREDRCTYPVFFKDAAGEPLFRYRDGSSGDGRDLYNRYDTTTRTWRRLLDRPLLDGEGQRNAYSIQPTLGPDGLFHLVWMWRETPDASSNHTLCYARSRDLVHWEDSRGQPLTLPITLATSDVVDPAKEKEGLINMTMALGFDAARRPVISYHRYDAQGNSQVFAARPHQDGGWLARQVSDWTFRWAFSGGGSLEAEVNVGAARAEKDGSLILPYSAKPLGAGRWRLKAGSLERLEQLPPPPSLLPSDLLRVQSDYPGMQVQTLVSQGGGRRWVLRWETLGRNRDRPREVSPPPSELRLYELPEAEVTALPQVAGQ